MLTTLTLLAVATEGNAFSTALASDQFATFPNAKGRVSMGAICPAGGIQDGEACGSLLNDPCNTDAPGVPNFVTDGDTICGTCFTYQVQDDQGNTINTRDRDYSLYTHPGGAIDVTSVSGADMANFIVPFDPADVDCAIGPIAGWVSTAGAPTTQRVFAPAGDYYILAMAPAFEGFDCGVGDFEYAQTIASDVDAVCVVEAEAGDDVEIEPCGVGANEGCNGELPFQFENITAGVPFKGTTYSGLADPNDPDAPTTRDTDWMLYDHPGGAIVYTSVADFPFQGLVVSNVTDCIGSAVVFATEVNGSGCLTQTDVSGFIPAGTYAIWAGVALNDDGSQRDLECAGNYRITVVSDTSVTDPCEGTVEAVCDVVPDSIYPANASDPIALGTGGVACGAGGVTTPNTFANPYSASDIAPGEDLNLTCISFGSFNGGSQLPVSIQVWLDTDGGAPSAPGADLQPLSDPISYCAFGSSIVQISFPEPVVIPADSNFVVSMDLPQALDGFASYETTDAPVVSETHILSAACGLTTFLSLDDIGFAGTDWGVELYFGGEVSLPCPTDLDGDGDTDFNDILIVLSNFGSDGSAGGDADEDGDVDFNDLINLLSAFGPCP